MEKVEELNKKEIITEIVRFSMFMAFLVLTSSFVYNVGFNNGEISQCEELGMKKVSVYGDELVCMEYEEQAEEDFNVRLTNELS